MPLFLTAILGIDDLSRSPAAPIVRLSLRIRADETTKLRPRSPSRERFQHHSVGWSCFCVKTTPDRTSSPYSAHQATSNHRFVRRVVLADLNDPYARRTVHFSAARASGGSGHTTLVSTLVHGQIQPQLPLHLSSCKVLGRAAGENQKKRAWKTVRMGRRGGKGCSAD